MYGHPLLVKILPQPVSALRQTDRGPAAQHRWEAIGQTLPIDESRVSEMALAHVMALASSDELRVHLLNLQPSVTAADVTPFTSEKAVEMQRRGAGECTLGGAKRALRARRSITSQKSRSARLPTRWWAPLPRPGAARS